MEQITMRPYQESDREELENFKLSKAQHAFTSLPVEILDAALDDKDKYPVVVLNSDDDIVGFFQLHKNYQHVGYATPEDVIYIRSLSVNESFQGRGYGTMIAMQLPSYVQANFGDLEHFYLVVDGDNEAAWNLYERAGFINVAIKEHGPIGEERLYYLDLNQEYVHNIKLKEDMQHQDFKADIILDQKTVIGHIEGVVNGKEFTMTHIEIDEDERGKGYASSALRQLPALLRRTNEEVEVITVDGRKVEADSKLLDKVGYSKFVDDELQFKKYIK